MSEDLDLQRLPCWFGDGQNDTLSVTQWIHFVEKTRGQNKDTGRVNHNVITNLFL